MTWLHDFYVSNLERVVEWNYSANNNRSIPELLELLEENQKRITVSEINETYKGLDQNDRKEILDGVCDVFVTAGFMAFMQFETLKPTRSYFNAYDNQDTMTIMGRMYDILGMLKEQCNPEYLRDVDSGLVAELIYLSAKLYGKDAIVQYMANVLKSNESKFVPISQWNESVELAHANEVYGKEFNNIVGVKREFMGNPVMIVRADNGVGKILKPTLFVEP